MGNQYAGKMVFVTGAGLGIGFGIARAFAIAGAHVGLNDMYSNRAKAAANRVNTEIGSNSVIPYTCDIADTTALSNAMDNFCKAQGQIDIVVANAGITNYGKFIDYSVEAFDRIVSVNLRGTYFTAQFAARQMVQNQVENGRIILMSSVTGHVAYPHLSAYGMTKAAISHLAKVIAVELGPYDITVNAICPGATITERTLKDDPDYDANWSEVIPGGRAGHVADIVNATLFLASPATSQLNGQTLVIDGGWTNLSPIPKAAPDLPEESSKLR